MCMILFNKLEIEKYIDKRKENEKKKNSLWMILFLKTSISNGK